MQNRYLQVQLQEGVRIARFTEGWLTTELAKGALGDELLALAEHGDCTKLLLDFSGVTYLSSSVLGKLMTLYKQWKAKGGQLAVCELTPTAQEIFALMKLDQVFAARPTQSEALAAWQQADAS